MGERPESEDTGGREGVRRIVVAVDASEGSLAALRAATELAAALEAELEGLFVEDVELLRLGTAAAVEVDALSAELRPLDSVDLRRQLRLQARRARRALERAAVARRIRWTFRTARGRVASELRAAAVRADLLIVGARSGTPGRGPGSTARGLLRRADAPLMLLGRRGRLGGKVFVVWDGSEAAVRALALGEALAAPRDVDLVIVVPGGAGEAAEGLLEEALRAARQLSTRPEVLRLSGPGVEPRELAAAAGAARCGLLVLPRGGEATGPAGLRTLLAAGECPVLVVGPRPAAVRESAEEG